jgi:hypothetical protein
LSINLIHTKCFHDRINLKYILKSYLLSGFYMMSLIIVFILTNEYEGLTFIIISYIFFPFAKIVCDLVVGFRLADKINQSERISSNSMFIYRLELVMYLLILFLSLFLAPFGILYLIIRFIYRTFSFNGIYRK